MTYTVLKALNNWLTSEHDVSMQGDAEGDCHEIWNMATSVHKQTL